MKRRSIGDIIFNIFNTIFMLIMIAITLYPILYVAFASLSDSSQLMSHTGLLLRPLGFNLKGYAEVFKNPMTVMTFGNTVFYVVVGTAINMFVTTLGAYALSRPQLWIKKYVNLGIVFTMFFSGGLIPLYLLVKNIGIYDTRWSLLLPVAVNSWNYMVMRTSFSGFSVSLEEAAKIDGANDFQILAKIALPVFGSTLAVMVLFYAVQHWNSWFDGMLYIKDMSLKPLQTYLRSIVIVDSAVGETGMTLEDAVANATADGANGAKIFLAIFPIMCVYPFLQKYFAKGLVRGSVKE